MNGKKIRFCGVFLPLFALSFLLSGCVSSSRGENAPDLKSRCSRDILAPGIKNQNQLVQFFLSENPDVQKTVIEELAALYVKEAEIEGINSDCAFVQMCLETGFLRFGNLVTPDMHNYCGLGATDEDHPGERFLNAQTGVRAHIQHLQAYATESGVMLKQELVDPRYSWVHRTKKAENVFQLAGQWAADLDYGLKLDRLLTKLDAF